jgi:hypothetical protein
LLLDPKASEISLDFALGEGSDLVVGCLLAVPGE